jgi:hypothetical protein
MATLTPIASMALLRDVLIKLQVPGDLEQEIRETLERPLPDLGEARPFLEALLGLAERCIAAVEVEMGKQTEARFSAQDPMALRQKLLAEPRKQVDAQIIAIKQKLGAERQEWARRVARQATDVHVSIEQQVETLEFAQQEQGSDLVLLPDPQWKSAFDAWKAEVFARWASHLPVILVRKTSELLRPEIEALGTVLGKELHVELKQPAPLRLPQGKELEKPLFDRIEIPTIGAAVFEVFKDKLNTVAMIAGLIVIPVVGSLMHTAALTMRAAVMGGALFPIVLLAVLQGAKHRRRLRKNNVEKAHDRLKKAIGTEAKTDFDRFKPDAERYCGTYCVAAQQQVLSAIEPVIAQIFERREKDVAVDLARAQLHTDKLNDGVNMLRQLRTSLAGQLVIDVKRRLQDAPTTAAATAAAGR